MVIGVIQRFVFDSLNVGNSKCYQRQCRVDATGGLCFPSVCRGSCSLTHTLRVYYIPRREHEFCLFLAWVSYDLRNGWTEKQFTLFLCPSVFSFFKNQSECFADSMTGLPAAGRNPCPLCVARLLGTPDVCGRPRGEQKARIGTWALSGNPLARTRRNSIQTG